MNAAVLAGNSSTVWVLEEIKSNIDRSSHPHLTGHIKKTAALQMELLRKKRKSLGLTGHIPKEPEEILTGLPDHLTKTTTGSIFLVHKDFLYEDGRDNTKIIMIFMSEHGKFVMRNSVELYVVGTFDLAPAPFVQIYIILGKIPEKRPVPVMYALFPDKNTDSYRRMVQVVKTSKRRYGIPERLQ